LTRGSKKVLVTGGSGFIGSNLVRELEKRGHEVWVCDLMHSWRPNYFRCDVGRFSARVLSSLLHYVLALERVNLGSSTRIILTGFLLSILRAILGTRS